jgi:hypothetical protein
MTNDEVPNDERTPNDEVLHRTTEGSSERPIRHWVLRHSFVIGYFVIRAQRERRTTASALAIQGVDRDQSARG